MFLVFALRRYDEQYFKKLKLSFWVYNHRFLVSTHMEILHKQKETFCHHFMRNKIQQKKKKHTLQYS